MTVRMEVVASISILGLSAGGVILLLGAATLFDVLGLGHWLWSSEWNWFWKERVGYRGWCTVFGTIWFLFGTLVVVVSI